MGLHSGQHLHGRGTVIQGSFLNGRLKAAPALQRQGAAGPGARLSRPGVDAFPVNLRPKSGGYPLPPKLLSTMESALGARLGDVRIHVGPEASAIGAVAFTWGTNIHFAPGQYQPHTAPGLRLLGHELAHVVQQRQGRVANPFGTGVAVVQDRALEAEADRLGAAVATRVHQALQPAAKTAADRPVPIGRPQAAQAKPSAIQPISEIAKKRLKNVFTLGIRKAYVKAKRARRARAQAPVAIIAPPPVATTNNPLEVHRSAYNQSRFYHTTSHQNATSIHKTGLLNQTDRIQVLGQDVGGMSRIDPAYQGDEAMGVFLGGKAFAQENKTGTLSGPKVRAVLPPQRTNKPIMWFASDPKPTGPNDGRLFRDKKFPGGGLYTPASIDKDQVWYGKFTELSETTDQAKIKAICETIAAHYPNPKPTWQEVYQNHLNAIEEGYVSDEALDD